nr:hypothetical protein [Sphingobium sp. AS12]
MRADAFPQAWREHSAFASTFGQSFRKYFKGSCQMVRIWTPDLPESFSNIYDGSALLTMVSREGLLAARYQPGTTDALKKDEERVFASYVDDWTMNAEEYLVAGEEKGEFAILSFLFPTVSIDSGFWDASRTRVEALAASSTVAAASCIAGNKVVDPSRAHGFGAMIEIWFADLETATRAAHDSALVTALEQADIADPSQGARLLARRNPRSAA